ncbi:MAG: NAD(P)H-dependent oxidoreductase subunit E [Deltaproteobacteria bacterium]
MALSEELKQRIRAEFPKYPEKRAVLITALHFAQEEGEGWIEASVIPEIGALLDIPAIDVKEVVSFYAMFNESPVGKRHLRVCTGLSCCLRGARRLQNRIQDDLDLRPFEVTADGVFSVGSVECLGSCGTAPVLQVNNRVYIENLGSDDVPALLDNLRREVADEDAESA